MAYDANGNWVPEDESVSGRVASLTSKDSPLMQQAQGLAMKTANRRGLLNSSIAARAGADAAIGAATPIASQEAQQAANANLAARSDLTTRRGQDLSQSLGLAQIDTTKRGQDLDYGQATRGQDLNYNLGLAQNATTQRGQDVAAATTTRGQDIDYAATTRGQDVSYAATTRGQDLDYGATTRGQDIQQQLGLASDATTRRGQDITAQQNADQNRERITAALTQITDSYNQLQGQILANDKLSATARDNYLASAKNVTASNMALLEQLYGVDLSWGPNGYGTPSAANDTQTGLAPVSTLPIATPPAGAVRSGYVRNYV